MDSQEKDESKIRRREEMLARRVGEALDKIQSQEALGCPDAEVIAGYAEQALGPAESAHWEGHFATCARCRMILRVLSASADAPLAEKEVARLGKLVSADRVPIEITRGAAGRARPGIADWRMRWLPPALGAAAVLAVWLAMRPPWRATNPVNSPTLVAQAPKDELPMSPPPREVDRLSRVAPQQDLKAETAPRPKRSSNEISPQNAPMKPPAKDRADAGGAPENRSPGPTELGGSLQAEKKLKALPDASENQPAAISPAPPAPPKVAAARQAPATPQLEARAASGVGASGSSQVESNGNVNGSAPSRDKQAATVQGDAATVAGGKVGQAISPEARPTDREEQSFEVFRSVQKYDALLKTPSGSALWRAGKGGMIERSTDAGKTWVSQASPSQEDWLAGAAVSDTVCWLAGRNGAIARTADGVRWERIAPPPQAAGNDARLPDWNAIVARDGQSATIAATDGRRFATADAGKTWQLQ